MDASTVSAYIFLSSIAHIGTLKRGPFNEHSPIMYNIATTVPNWQKINSGLTKMYQAEVLEKHPVVQHFCFGGILPWTKAGTGEKLPSSGDVMLKDVGGDDDGFEDMQTKWQASTQAPWAMPASVQQRQGASTPPVTVTAAPWARSAMTAEQATSAPWTASQAPLRSMQARPPVQASAQTLASSGSAAAMSSPLGAISQPSTGYPRSQPGRQM